MAIHETTTSTTLDVRANVEAQQQKQQQNQRMTRSNDVRYEDDRVKLTGNELILKSYNEHPDGPNSDETILISSIDRVCWSGNTVQPDNYMKSMLKKKTQGMKMKLRNNLKSTERKSKRKKNKTNKKYKRFVVVASKNGTPSGLGFSVDDPKTFHKLMDNFITTGSPCGLLKRTYSSESLHSALAKVSSNENLLKRVTSTENLLRQITLNDSLLKRVASTEDLLRRVTSNENFIKRVTSTENFLLASTENLLLRRVTSTENILKQAQQVQKQQKNVRKNDENLLEQPLDW